MNQLRRITVTSRDASDPHGSSPQSISRDRRNAVAFRWVAALLALVAVTWSLFTSTGIRYRLDTDVYRLGAQRILDGQDLYSGSFLISDDIFLPFTYPPISALAFVPLTIFTAHGASLVFGIVNIGAIAGIVWLLLTHLGHLPATTVRWLVVFLTGALIFFGPVASTLNYGQVNLILVLMIVLDATVVPPRFRGILTGLATAFKLTPAVFGLWFLLRKDVPSILRMGVSALVATGIGFLFLPDASMRYWFGTLQKTDRIGGLGYSSNQSFNGELWRLGVRTADAGTAWWLLLVGIALVATVAVMIRLFRRGLPVLALCVNAFFGLLASPVSWDHHFVWVAVFVVVLGIYWYDPASRPGGVWTPAQLKLLAGLAISGIVCCAVSPRTVAPSSGNVEQEWNIFWHVLGNAYMWWMIAAFVVLWLVASPRHVRAEAAPARSA